MPFCSGCGTEVGTDVSFCPKCGAPSGTTGAPRTDSPAASSSAGSGLEENVAGLLCYVLGWVTGLILLLIDKRPFVRFHAMQSLVTFGGFHAIQLVLIFGGVMGAFASALSGGFLFGIVSFLVYGVLSLVILVSWIICMVKAFQGQKLKLPIVGNIAENFAK